MYLAINPFHYTCIKAAGDLEINTLKEFQTLQALDSGIQCPNSPPLTLFDYTQGFYLWGWL